MIVQSYDWETNTYTHHADTTADTDTMASHEKWLECVHTVGERAKTSLPTHDARIGRAIALVLDGHVTPQADGSFQVRSQRGSSSKNYRVTTQCECVDAQKVSDGWCKHVLAKAIYIRAKRLLQEPAAPPTDQAQEPTAVEPTLTVELDPQQCTIDPQHIITIQGKAFVKFAGLLALAHERGLVALTADWTYNDAELSLAHAVATFADGRRFEESGDASPANTNRKVAVHFRRVALTRAKARVLRDALGIDLVAVEELADSE